MPPFGRRASVRGHPGGLTGKGLPPRGAGRRKQQLEQYGLSVGPGVQAFGNPSPLPLRLALAPRRCPVSRVRRCLSSRGLAGSPGVECAYGRKVHRLAAHARNEVRDYRRIRPAIDHHAFEVLEATRAYQFQFHAVHVHTVQTSSMSPPCGGTRPPHPKRAGFT